MIVLALLAMFGLLAIGFVVIASQAKRTSLQQQRVEQYYDPYDSLLYQGLLQALRGSNNRGSVMGPHCLLDAMYGNTTAPGVVLRNPPFVLSGGILTLPLASGPSDPTIPHEAPRRVGCVLTMIDGPCRGMSTRIVYYQPGNPADPLPINQVPRFQTLQFDGGAQPNAGDSYVINGAPFSGTGFGYNPYFGQDGAENQIMLTAGIPFPDPDPKKPPFGSPGKNSLLRYALLPNPVAFIGNPALQYTDPAGPGGANSDYTAADYQHMLVAGISLDLATGKPRVVSPSLHRPELVTYWYVKLFNAPHDVLDPINQMLYPSGPALDVWPQGWTAQQKGQAIDQPESLPSKYPKLANVAQLANVIAAFKRLFILRPLRFDHPNFTGSNPYFKPQWDGINPGGGQWDVDTDGDGVPDAIWVDLGFPARAAPNGKMYKPLFAILCLDLDGRLNLNAHGSLAQTQQTYYLSSSNPNPVPSNRMFGVLASAGVNIPGLVGNTFADGTTASSLPRRGQGYGPAEVNLGALFGLPSNPSGFTAYQQLLAGGTISGSPVDGRYGESQLLGANWFPGVPAVPAPGRTSLALPPAPPNFDPRTDPLGYNKFVDFPDNYLLSIIPGLPAGSQETSYGNIPELKGTLAVGLDPRGQPICDVLPDLAAPDPANPFNHARANHPYELNLSQKRSRGLPNESPDNPFSVAEMERFFRSYDRDAPRLPSRVALLTGSDPVARTGLFAFPRSYEFTTESWSVPVPKTAYPAWLATALQGANGLPRLSHPVDLARARLAPLMLPPPNGPGLTQAQVDQLISNLLPLEFLAGRKMDLNRPWGNGRDDNGNGVVDEWGEGDPKFGYEPYYSADAGRNVLPPPNAPRFNYGLDPATGRPLPNGLAARQLYARHLYVLAQLLIDPTYYPPWIPPGDNAAKARWLAQWAVNVVDFRDRDSIMTPFEYDINPFTNDDGNPQGRTWNVDGRIDAVPPPADSDDARPWRGLVWGCERPELLITETLAVHARRYTVKTDDNGKVTGRTQKLRPLGSLFVEVFNPWSGAEGDGGEFGFDRASNRHQGGVLLSQRSQLGGSPVWRMAVVAGSDSDKDPDDPNPQNPRPTIRRTIYFADPSGLPTRPGMIDDVPSDAAAPKNKTARFFAMGGVAPIVHNHYAVIGPNDAANNYKGETFLSRPKIPQPDSTSSTDYPLKKIVLNPAAVLPTRQVSMLNNNDPNDPNNQKLNSAKPPIAVLISGAKKLEWAGAGEPATVSDVDTRLSVSEPEDGYDPTKALIQWQDYYSDHQGEYQYVAELPGPADSDNKNLGGSDGLYLGNNVLHLQRLANPLLAYNRYTNPYLTIDSVPIDLYVYNGWWHDPEQVEQNEKLFRTRQRGSQLKELGSVWPKFWPNEQRNIWWGEPWGEPEPDPDSLSDTNYVLPFALRQSLGFLNEPFWPMKPGTLTDEYAGDPQPSPPFPWLNWDNRPFVSEMELLLVPWLRSSQLLRFHTLATVRAADNPYTSDGVIDPEVVKKGDPLPPNPVVSFQHLPNFFFSQVQGNPAAPTSSLYRLLEFVGVPSRFVGTETFGNPQLLRTGGPFAPPFNAFSTYREPGRINLNTIPGTTTDSAVFRGLLNRPDLGHNNLWDQFLRTRDRGYPPYSANLPTRIVNPYRGYGGASLVPLPELRQAITGPAGGDINATLLRPTDADLTVPLFLSNSQSTQPNSPINTDRNPYFRYQELQRLANKVTTQSNVYAVWITVGYFEAEPNPAGVDAVHPDGYRLGAELGSDTGEVKRHRGFFVIDRSIPVGFQRGKDLNVEKTILLKRYIE